MVFAVYPGPSVGWDNSVDTATGCGLDGPGIESLRGRDFPHPFRRASDDKTVVYSYVWVVTADSSRLTRLLLAVQ